MLPSPFHPTPHLEAQILDALADPTRSLRDIAHDHNTTVPALTAWLARPDIDARVQLIDDAASRRLALIAANCLPSVIAAATSVLDTFHAEEKRLTPDPTTQAKRTDHKTDCRARSNALRAAGLIHRLSQPKRRHQPQDPRTPRAQRPLPERAPRAQAAPSPALHHDLAHQLLARLVTLNPNDTDAPDAHAEAAVEESSRTLEDFARQLECETADSADPAPALSPALCADPTQLPDLNYQTTVTPIDPREGLVSKVTPPLSPSSRNRSSRHRPANALAALAGIAPGP